MRSYSLTRPLRPGKPTNGVGEVSYAITSLGTDEAGPTRLMQLVRGHWHIENRLHYVRDVTLSEDLCAVRIQAAPYAMAALRNGMLGGACAMAEAERWEAIRQIVRMAA